jgi:hypothetical protein
MSGAIQWYDREHLPYAPDRRTVEKYAAWLRLIPWKFFCTFTFARKVSDPEAIWIFKEFISQLECKLKCDISYGAGAEKRFSGCGKPACGRHFHAVMTCAASPDPWLIECLWESLAGYPPHQRMHAAQYQYKDVGAKVETYDPNRNAVSYVLKLINKFEGDWHFRKLHLVHPHLQAENLKKRSRRNLRRHEERIQAITTAN